MMMLAIHLEVIQMIVALFIDLFNILKKKKQIKADLVCRHSRL